MRDRIPLVTLVTGVTAALLTGVLLTAAAVRAATVRAATVRVVAVWVVAVQGWLRGRRQAGNDRVDNDHGLTDRILWTADGGLWMTRPGYVDDGRGLVDDRPRSADGWSEPVDVDGYWS